MPEVLVTKDDKAVTILSSLSSRDFEEQIEKYIGSDFAKHYHRQIEELSYCVRELASYVNDKDIRSEMEEVLSVNGF